MNKRRKEYLESMSEKDKAYRESLSLQDQALYDYFSMSPVKPKNANGGFTLESALGPELTVGDCTAELWAKIGFTE
jgi:type II secretory pathway component PulC